MDGFLEDGALIDQIGRLVIAPATVTTVVLLALIPIMLWARRVYFHRYLRRRLYFDPWMNLSGDAGLDIGASLAELLYFELESLRELLRRGRESEGLWNERSTIPLLERLFEGYPAFVRHVELLGLPGRVANLARFVLAVKPQRIQGTIHRFGDIVRFQVMLDGSAEAMGEASDETASRVPGRRRGQVAGRGEVRTVREVPQDPERKDRQESRQAPDETGRQSGGARRPWLRRLRPWIAANETARQYPVKEDARPRVGWSKELPANDREAIPDAVKEIAHQMVLDLGRIKAFKSAKSFMHFTAGLREHLAFNELRGREEIGKAAIRHYQESIKVQSQNPLASYAIAQILYSSYDPDGNEGAIEQYQKALQTDIQTLRAKAFRGLADAYAQRVHRHHRGGDDVIEAALVWAEFAQELCDADDQASIKKALAFATQIQANRPGVKEEYREQKIEEAMKLYQEAADCDLEFTVAHNNLGFLYLERAKKNLNALLNGKGDSDSESDRRRELEAKVREDLRLGEERCLTAIRCDPTYHHAYDNLGNIWFERSRLPGGDAAEAFRNAEKSYYKAVAYNPAYAAAYSDLARLYLRRKSSRGMSPHRAWDAHWRSLEVVSDEEARKRRCADFREEIRLISRDDWPALRTAGEKDRARTSGCTCFSEPWEMVDGDNKIHNLGVRTAG